MQTNFDELRKKYGRNRNKTRTPSNKPSTQRGRWKAFSERAEILANEHGAEIVIAVHFPNKKCASSKLKYYGKLEKTLENCPETIAFHNFFLAQCTQHEGDVTGVITSTVSDGGRDSSSDNGENTAAVALIPQASTLDESVVGENTEATVFYVGTDGSFDCGENTVEIVTHTPKASCSIRPIVAKKIKIAPRESCITTEHTLAIYNFGEEPVPFCSRIPGRNITLKRFKEFCITRNGNFKYFFKTILDCGSSMVVYQEVTDDSEVLPLWENKLIGMVKSVE